MIGELVRAWTEDDLQLQGLYCTPHDRSDLPAVLHIHGASSNFYRSQFLDRLADVLTQSGFAFLTGNTRGHDIMNKVYSKDPTATRYLGVAYEVFEECALDVAAWTAFLRERKHKEVVLLGHSFGAQKVAFYQSDAADERVKGLIFMSPADRGLRNDALGSEAERLRSWAKEEMSSGRGETLLDAGFAPYPMSARAIHGLLAEAKSDIFRFGRPDEPWNVVAGLSCPMLVTMGTVAEFISTSPQDALATLRDKAVSSPRCDTVVIEGAPHNYRGFEAQVAEVMLEWLMDIFGG